MKKIAIVGLGLIGASLVKSIKFNTNNKVFGFDKSEKTIKMALEDEVLDAVLDENNISECDIIILCLYPRDTIEFVKNSIPKMKKSAIIVDCAGVKMNICESLSSLCAENGLYFIGGHPMAGSEKSGYEHSYHHLFDNATMVLCKDEYTDSNALKTAKNFFETLGFSKITFSNAQEHDNIIAFTSQLAHVVSNAYIQSEQAKMQMGFSAGSYKDLTRVAYLNEKMWTELFIENKKPLVNEIRSLAERLETYATAIENGDEETLMQILHKGKIMKENIG